MSSLGFRHYEQSIRVVEKLENKGFGLNLTKEVRDGILNHPTKGKPMTMEGKVVRISDKIAYINHDIDDAIRANIITDNDLPMHLIAVLGKTSKERINTIIHDLVSQSAGKDDIILSDKIYKAMSALRKYMFDNVYIASKAKEETNKAENMIKQLYFYYMEHLDEMPEEFSRLDSGEREVMDYIAGMTDRYAIKLYEDLFVPKSWKG